MKNLVNKIYSLFFTKKKCCKKPCSTGQCDKKIVEEKVMGEAEKKPKKTTKAKPATEKSSESEVKTEAPKRKKP